MVMTSYYLSEFSAQKKRNKNLVMDGTPTKYLRRSKRHGVSIRAWPFHGVLLKLFIFKDNSDSAIRHKGRIHWAYGLLVECCIDVY